MKIVPKDGLFDYANKYQAGGASEICPPVSLDAETQELIQRAGERAFEALRMDVYSRADFIVSDADGEILLSGNECPSGNDRSKPYFRKLPKLPDMNTANFVRPLFRNP